MSSAAKHVLHEALLWGAVAVTGFALFYFFQRRFGARHRFCTADRVAAG